MVCASIFQAKALPLGGVTTSGSATITHSPQVTSIQQNSQKAAIQWLTFNVAANEMVKVSQPNSNSVLLNRVTNLEPSQIFGTLKANGQVFLINANGVLFGPSASVNTAGFLASTLDIKDADFEANRYQFMGKSTASIINQGVLKSDGGYVALLGSLVDNQGRIDAPVGSVVLASGQAMSMEIMAGGLLNVHVSEGALQSLVQNGGVIQADGGQIVMSANSANELIQSVVNTTGVLQAQTLKSRNGVISLEANGVQSPISVINTKGTNNSNGRVEVSGKLDVSGLAPGQLGGTIVVTGSTISMTDAKLLASGDIGGGSVEVGRIASAQSAVSDATRSIAMNDASRIDSDAVTLGQGGVIKLLASDLTSAHGVMSARGGAQGGNGGFIETSANRLQVAGLKVDTLGPMGLAGMWLLDPSDVSISSAATSGDTLSGGAYTPITGVSVSNINVAELVVALNTSNVMITTANTGVSGAGFGDINLDAALTWTAATTLSMNAARDVSFNQALTGTNGSLVAVAGRDVNVLAAMTTTTGNFELTAARNVNLNAATTITTGHLNAIAGQDVNLTANATITGGNMLLRADNDGTGPGLAGGTVTISCGLNCVTLTNGVLSIRFNPSSDSNVASEITAYDTQLTGATHALDAKAWLFVKGVDKAYDGTTNAQLALVGGPPTAVLTPGTANFSSKNVAVDQNIVYDTYAVSGEGASYVMWSPLNVAFGSGTTSAEITAVPLQISANASSKLFGAPASLPGFTTIGLVNGDTVTHVDQASSGAVATAPVQGSPYAIVPSGATGNFAPGNYTITYVNGNLTIAPAPLSITANDVSKNYGQVVTIPTTAFSSQGLVNGDTVTGVVSTSAGSVATARVSGSPYAIVPSAAEGTLVLGNYNISYINGALTVVPTNLSITANDASKNYGQTSSLSPQAFSSVGLVNSEVINAATLASAGTASTANVAGSPYAIHISDATGSFEAGNYNISYIDGRLTVFPAALAVTATNATKVYGQSATLLSTAFKSSGLVNGDTLTSVVNQSSGDVAGAPVSGSPYPITPSAATGNFVPGNYTITYVNGILTVTPAPLTITANDIFKTYGQTIVLPGTAFSSTGLVNGEQITSLTEQSLGQLSTAYPGTTYPITLSQPTGADFNAGNYSIDYVDGKVTVSEIPVVVPNVHLNEGQLLVPQDGTVTVKNPVPVFAKPAELQSLKPLEPLNSEPQTPKAVEPSLPAPVLALPPTQQARPDNRPPEVKPLVPRPPKQDRN
jgi:filamentous hemagglutinin family protein